MLLTRARRVAVHCVVAVVAAVAVLGGAGTAVVVGPTGWAQWTGQVQVNAITVGVPREYRVYRPAQLPARPGLVLDLHSAHTNGFLEEAVTGMHRHADERGWIVAYPNGRDGTWPDDGIDDVAFLSRIIDRLEVSDHVDPDRVYVMGLSRGGMMAYRLACELPGRIAAVAAVAGNLADHPCTLPRPVSVLAVHGSADPVIQLDGGGRYPPFSAVVDRWRALDGCAATPGTVRVTGVLTSTHWPCPAGAEVRSIVIAGAGHTWPGAPLESPPWSPAAQFDASATIADFFGGHRAG